MSVDCVQGPGNRERLEAPEDGQSRLPPAAGAPRPNRDVVAERQRMARELHDGLAQELALIASQTARLLAGNPQDPVIRDIREAAQRALKFAREAIYDLRRAPPGPTSTRLADYASTVALRGGMALQIVRLDPMELDCDGEHQLLRLVGEAVGNALRHARASTISLELARGQDTTVVRVCDDGCGIPADVTTDQRRCLGIEGMRERAQLLGADFRLASVQGGGTCVEVCLPSDGSARRRRPGALRFDGTGVPSGPLTTRVSILH